MYTKETYNRLCMINAEFDDLNAILKTIGSVKILVNFNICFYLCLIVCEILKRILNEYLFICDLYSCFFYL